LLCECFEYGGAALAQVDLPLGGKRGERSN
jgi:hypothetical protein